MASSEASPFRAASSSQARGGPVWRASLPLMGVPSPDGYTDGCRGRCLYHEMGVIGEMALVGCLTLVLKFVICFLHCVCY